jgi:ubiquinone/menaquinone biosynthesis C-methylase UbiE
MSFSDPSHIIAQFDLQSGSRVADLGAGSGELSIAAARVVGEAGRVYAIEIQSGLVERLKGRAKEARVQNVEPLWGDIERPEGTHLKDETVDAVLASNVLFQAEDRAGLVAEAKRILKLGGRVLVVDWSGSPWNTLSLSFSVGPRGDHRITESEARRLFEQGRFSFVKSIAAGAHQYGMIFRKV